MEGIGIVQRFLATCLLSVLIALDVGGPTVHPLLHSLPAYSLDEADSHGSDSGTPGGQDTLSPNCPLFCVTATRPLPNVFLEGPAESPTTQLTLQQEPRTAVDPVTLVAHRSRAPPR